MKTSDKGGDDNLYFVSPPPSKPPFETGDDFPPYLHDEGVYYTYPEDNRVHDNANLPIQTLFTGDNAGDSSADMGIKRNPRPSVESAELPENSAASATISTTTTPITASNPLNGALATLATLGIITAGAGAITMTATALAKKREQDEAKATQMATLQKQQSAQAQSAGANWAENQTMQVNATQKVYTKVVQSDVNRAFELEYRQWVRAEQQRQIQNILNIILNTSVSITLVPKPMSNERPILSLGTIANYNGRQVLVTHDHYGRPGNQRNSLANIQADFSHVYISSISHNVAIDVSYLHAEYKNNGIMFLSLTSENGAFVPFNVTPMVAEIAFSYFPSPNEECYYGFVRGFNADKQNQEFSFTIEQNLMANPVRFVPHSVIEIEGRTMILDEKNVNGLITEWGGSAGPGDSGSGLFNSSGQLIGVLQATDARNATIGDTINNLLGAGLHGIEVEPAVGNNKFNVITP